MGYGWRMGDLASAGVLTVDTAQDLRDYPISDLPAVGPMRTLGAVSVGVGGGDWRYVSGAAPGTHVDNLGTTLVPTGGNGSAAWLRISDEVIPLAAFGDDLEVAVRSGVSRLTLGGRRVALNDVAFSGESLSTQIEDGEFVLGGPTGITLTACTGQLVFRGVDFDGNGQATTQAFIHATDDAALTLRFEAGRFHNIGTAGSPGWAIKVKNARGGFFGTSFEYIVATGSRAVVMAGYGPFGCHSCNFYEIDGNAIKLGEIGDAVPTTSGHSFAINNQIIGINDSASGTGQSGNGVVAFCIRGHRIIGNRIQRVYASFIRENNSGGQVIGNICRDCGLVGIFHELGANRSIILGNTLEDIGAHGISVTNPSDITDTYPQTLVAGNRVQRVGYQTTYSAEEGRDRVAGILAAWGLVQGNTVSDVNSYTENLGCGFSSGAQNFSLEVAFVGNRADACDYLIGVGAATNKTHEIRVDGLYGTYRVAPIRGLGGAFSLVDLGGGRGDKVRITNVVVPRALRPIQLEPGSFLIDDESGRIVSFVGTGPTTGAYEDVPTVFGGSAPTLSRDHLYRNTVFTNGTAVLTIPPNATTPLPLGQPAYLFAGHASLPLTITPAVGVTVRGTTSLEAGANAKLVQTATDTWFCG